jgi:hypothetical protein
VSGAGSVESAGQRVSFNFDVRESSNYTERGSVTLTVHDGQGRPDRYLAANVYDVRFSNASAYTPGQLPRSGVDTVVFSGYGTWNGQSGHRFEITASDRGETGVGVDTFAVKVLSPTGELLEVSGTLRDGNIQSHR